MSIEDESRKWLELGNDQFNKGNFREAIDSFDKALQIKPDDHEAWYGRGNALVNLGRYEEAIDSYDKALQIKPDYHEAWCNRGNALDDLGRYEEAIDSCDKAVQIKPDFHQAWFNRGNALVNLGRYEEAIDSYDKAVQIKPDYHEAWYNRGIALGNLGRYEESIDSYDKAIQIKPDKHEAWYGRGSALRKLGRYEDAIDSYDKALQIKPDYHEAWNNRGFALDDLGRYEEAIDSYDKALQIKPDYHEAWNNRGVALYTLGRYEEAIDSYDKAIQIKPDYHEAWYNRGFALGNLGRYEESIDSYDKALQIKPDYHDAWYNRGVALFNLGRYEESIDSCDKALQIKPDFHEAWHNRGIALFNLGRYEEAIDSYDKALQIKPDFHDAWNNRGNALVNLGRYEEAITSYDKAVQIKPDYHEAWNNRGIAAFGSPYSETNLNIFVACNLGDVAAKQPRGYDRAILSYKAGLFHCQDQANHEHQEGRGKLHRAKGDARIRHSKRTGKFSSLYKTAIHDYELALNEFTKEQFPEEHLATILKLISTHQALGNTPEVEMWGNEGWTFLNSLLEDPNRPETEKDKLRQRFSSQLNDWTFFRLLQQGQIREALDLAERDKNDRLRWFATHRTANENIEKNQPLACPNPHTAVIYWHLSDYALTTFLLLPNGEISHSIDLPKQGSTALRTEIEDWQKQYKDYLDTFEKSKPQTAASPAQPQKSDHPWRQEMLAKLTKLGELLHIPALELQCQAITGITSLLLVPHRELHLFPLPILFSLNFAISSVPSLAFGQVLFDRHQPQPHTPNLISIANPKGSLEPIPYADLEANLIHPTFPQASVTSFSQTTATIFNLKAALQKICHILHFSGHASHNPEDPKRSRLYFANDEPLSFTDIAQLALNQCQLVSLSACETSITSNQTILNEYIGLSSAFLYAGCSSVIGTLWTVNDISSCLLMVRFYQLYRGDSDYPTCQANSALSLRQAQTWLRSITRSQTRDLCKEWLQSSDIPPDIKDKIRAEIENSHENPAMQAAFDRAQIYNHPYHWAGFYSIGS